MTDVLCALLAITHVGKEFHTGAEIFPRGPKGKAKDAEPDYGWHRRHISERRNVIKTFLGVQWFSGLTLQSICRAGICRFL
jgi:hypothetical protein